MQLRGKREDPEFFMLLSNIREQFEYFIDNDNTYLMDDSEFLMRLSPKLRYKLLGLLFGKTLQDFGVFFNGLP